jgi:MFS family permease
MPRLDESRLSMPSGYETRARAETTDDPAATLSPDKSDYVSRACPADPLAHKLPTDAAVKRLFYVIFWLEIVLNFDSGAVPAVLEFITHDFRLTPSQQGLMGGLQYIGLTVMSPVAGYLLQNYSVKWVMAASLWTNTLACFLFAVAPNLSSLLISRTLIGLSQTCIIVFAPVWVDEFAIEGYQTMWMSCLQAGIPLGVMAGYAIAGSMAGSGVPWQWAILVQVNRGLSHSTHMVSH